MKPEVCIVAARKHELVHVRALAEIIWREHYPSVISPAQIEYMLERMYALETMQNEMLSGTSFDLICVGDARVGFISYGPASARGELKLHKLYLLARMRGQGLGQHALTHVEHYARTHGYRSISLQVNKRNYVAQRAYERAGFCVRESAVFEIGDGFVMDDYVLEKRV